MPSKYDENVRPTGAGPVRNRVDDHDSEAVPKRDFRPSWGRPRRRFAGGSIIRRQVGHGQSLLCNHGTRGGLQLRFAASTTALASGGPAVDPSSFASVKTNRTLSDPLSLNASASSRDAMTRRRPAGRLPPARLQPRIRLDRLHRDAIRRLSYAEPLVALRVGRRRLEGDHPAAQHPARPANR